MVKKAAQGYRVWIEPEVHQLRDSLPGSVRQRIRREIEKLSSHPRASLSKPMDVADLNLPPGVEVRRIRLENWRVIYAVNDTEGWVWILSIRRRPPYDYADLPELLSALKK